MEKAFFIGIVISFYLVFLLFTKKNKEISDKILLAWLFVTGLNLTFFYLFYTKGYYYFPHFLGLEAPLPLFQGPFLYLYTLSLTNYRPSNRTKFIHFAIPIFWYVLYLPFIFEPAAHKIEVYDQEGKGYEQIVFLTVSTLKISGVLYVILSYLAIRKHQKLIKFQFSNTEKINLNWLRYLILGIATIWLIVIFTDDDNFIYSAVSLFVIFIGYFGIKQVGIFSNNNIEDENGTNSLFDNKNSLNNNLEKIADRKKYSKSGLSDESAIILHENLKKLMIEKMLFKEAELTSVELSRQLDVHPNYLSQVINEKENVNFYDYINGLRVEEFKRLANIPENQKYTIISLAYDCGFNSKSAFNRIFKKHTSLLPSEYLKMQKVKIFED